MALRGNEVVTLVTLFFRSKWYWLVNCKYSQSSSSLRCVKHVSSWTSCQWWPASVENSKRTRLKVDGLGSGKMSSNCARVAAVTSISQVSADALDDPLNCNKFAVDWPEDRSSNKPWSESQLDTLSAMMDERSSFSPSSLRAGSSATWYSNVLTFVSLKLNTTSSKYQSNRPAQSMFTWNVSFQTENSTYVQLNVRQPQLATIEAP